MGGMETECRGNAERKIACFQFDRRCGYFALQIVPFQGMLYQWGASVASANSAGVETGGLCAVLLARYDSFFPEGGDGRKYF